MARGGGRQVLLADRTALVTGAARGIGRATAGLLAEHGANVLVADLDLDAAQAAATEIEGATAAFAGDITAPGVPEAMVASAVATWGGLDILVNNAGYSLNAPPRRAHRRALAPDARRPRDRADGDPARGCPASALRCGTGAGGGQGGLPQGGERRLDGRHGKCRPGELRGGANVVCPGAAATRLIKGAAGGDRLEIAGETVAVGQPPSVIDALVSLVSQIPFGRLATPAEIAGAVFFLCTTPGKACTSMPQRREAWSR